MGEPNLEQYLETVRSLLRDAAESETNEDAAALRAIVRERRNGRGRRTHASPSVGARADEIVDLLGRAACHLRPRETQQLDDLVAGKIPEPAVELQHPIRLHRTGRGIG
jgi:hypothetical protein